MQEIEHRLRVCERKLARLDEIESQLRELADQIDRFGDDADAWNDWRLNLRQQLLRAADGLIGAAHRSDPDRA